MNTKEWLDKINENPLECVKRAYELAGYEFIEHSDMYVIKGGTIPFHTEPLHESLDGMREFERKMNPNQWHQYVNNLTEYLLENTGNKLRGFSAYEAVQFTLTARPQARLAAWLATMENKK